MRVERVINSKEMLDSAKKNFDAAFADLMPCDLPAIASKPIEMIEVAGTHLLLMREPGSATATTIFSGEICYSDNDRVEVETSVGAVRLIVPADCWPAYWMLIAKHPSSDELGAMSHEEQNIGGFAASARLGTLIGDIADDHGISEIHVAAGCNCNKWTRGIPSTVRIVRGV